MLPEQTTAFRHALLGWYRGHARDLPWRRTSDPYLIWISEIMLQQTRVAAVLEHYARFTARFPSVHDLAAADEAEVLALWSGLGYYRRARSMHRAAKAVVAEYDGVFPKTAQALLALPGIGAYTAAAVASIAYGEPVAVVDGNVERVLTRVAALETLRPSAVSAEVRLLAGQLLDPSHPSHFNQAMMELGATVCLPRAPLCLQCPVQPLCLTRGEHPARTRKPLLPRDAWYALIQRGQSIQLEKRPADASLMAAMWQLPELTAAPSAGELLWTAKHAITVTNYTVRVYRLPENSGDQAHAWEKGWFELATIHDLPLTGLTRKIMRKLAAI